jgi:hypothetical protein
MDKAWGTVTINEAGCRAAIVTTRADSAAFRSEELKAVVL